MNASELPNSDHLNIAALSALFVHTTNSYKYLFFWSLLDILARQNFHKSLSISFREIIIEMLANAWYPHNYFKLSFGSQDKIADKLDTLALKVGEPILKFRDPDKKLLRTTIGEQDLEDIVNYITRYVPFRLLMPFMRKQLKGIDIDHGVDREMPKVAQLYFDTCKPLYCFDATVKTECRGIILHSEWVSYLQENYAIVRGWVCWEWLKYMQKCNPNVPAVANKLFPPQKRESLSSQTKYWKLVLQHSEVRCIYSGTILTPNNISLDYYLPWSYVAHDRLWNLVPTLPEINSSKSNKLPNPRYFHKFVWQQHQGLSISYKIMGLPQWLKQIESYLMDLKISNSLDLLEIDRLRSAYESTILPLTEIAARQGFEDWMRG
ncbi:MAG: HNH endonuclease domain-containing protein [Limnospira sp. PMC 894.15]|uniref:HNH endonuclease domain-containing protein n=1 Tax=Limnospira sp. PMC 894.15 TaxID=2981100 RepID=UPI0028E169AF|nr:HNH endonuclease domain-containing protein [Limnospira sp. PMC 894.15]MDT9189128.1 HNH endonuclease domain-containing protein [Limnospira sp. PMC 894.15]